jgi:D-amino peptidase
MKIYVVCDLEGVAGVVDHPQQCQWDVARGWYAPYLAQARRLATLELNALVEGALDGGATEVVAWDGHGNFPGGLDVEIVHSACRVVLGAGDGGPVGLDESFAGMFQLGLHAMDGAPRAVLAHSFDGSIAGYWVDDLRVGEIWMNLFTAGLSNVPCVFLSGDQAAADEVRALAPDVEVAVVKEGLSDGAGIGSASPTLSLSPEKARTVIREAARRAMGKIGSVKPFRPLPPFRLRAQFKAERFAEQRAGRRNARRLDSLTVEIERTDEPWSLL